MWSHYEERERLNLKQILSETRKWDSCQSAVALGRAACLYSAGIPCRFTLRSTYCWSLEAHPKKYLHSNQDEHLRLERFLRLFIYFILFVYLFLPRGRRWFDAYAVFLKLPCKHLTVASWTFCWSESWHSQLKVGY